MSLNHRQRRQLQRIEARMLRSDPKLAQKLGTFGKLSAGQRMPSWEHLDTRRDRIRQAVALIVETIALIVAATGLLVGAILSLVAAVVIGSHARLPVRLSRAARPGAKADGHPNRADWS
jgi:hypothetical protein